MRAQGILENSKSQKKMFTKTAAPNHQVTLAYKIRIP